MKKILLMCMGGLSTGLLVEKMRNAAKEKGVEVEINAISASVLDNVIANYDCLLIAPQISYMENEIAAKYPDEPYYVIQPKDYGRLNGEKVLAKALEICG